MIILPVMILPSTQVPGYYNFGDGDLSSPLEDQYESHILRILGGILPANHREEVLLCQSQER